MLLFLLTDENKSSIKININCKIPDAKIYDIKFISIFSIIMIIGMILMIMSYNYVVIRYLIIFTMLLIVFIKREAFLKVLSNVFSKNKA